MGSYADVNVKNEKGKKKFIIIGKEKRERKGIKIKRTKYIYLSFTKPYILKNIHF